MAPLLKIRSKRDQMSAIERRIADFILENAHLLRDYSSQQLASALKISQSSVVKFSQKLGFKGYPDLKYSVSEALARVDGVAQARDTAPLADDAHDALAQRLWAGKSHAEEETRLINPSERIDAVAAAVQAASRVFCIGLGEDGIAAHAFATKLALLGFASVYQPDPVLMDISAANAQPHDVLFAISEHGAQSTLGQIARQFRERHGTVVSLTRDTDNPLRAHAHVTLLISAHDPRPNIEPLLYQSAAQNLLDVIFVLLSDTDQDRPALTDHNPHNPRRSRRALDR